MGVAIDNRLKNAIRSQFRIPLIEAEPKKPRTIPLTSWDKRNGG